MAASRPTALLMPSWTPPSQIAPRSRSGTGSPRPLTRPPRRAARCKRTVYLPGIGETSDASAFSSRRRPKSSRSPSEALRLTKPAGPQRGLRLEASNQIGAVNCLPSGTTGGELHGDVRGAEARGRPASVGLQARCLVGEQPLSPAALGCLAGGRVQRPPRFRGWVCALRSGTRSGSRLDRTLG
jgi:hypothetical protein